MIRTVCGYGVTMSRAFEGLADGATMFPSGQTDRYGAYVDIPMKPGPKD